MHFTERVREFAEKFSKAVRMGTIDRELLSRNTIDAIALLTAQHREVDTLFDEIEHAGPTAHRTKENLLEILTKKLNLHTKIEEKFFYPEAKLANKDLVLEALEEHKNVKAMIHRLSTVESTDESFDAQVTTLKELVQHHVREEEYQLFPKCRAELSDQKLLEIGANMTAYLERGSQDEPLAH